MTTFRTHLARAVAGALALSLALTPAFPALAQPTAPASSARPLPIRARLVVPQSSVNLEGTINARAEIVVPIEVPYLQARLRMYRSDGGMIFQKTEVQHNVVGKVSIPFTEPLAGKGMLEQTVRLELDVFATDFPRLTLGNRVFLVDTARKPVQVAVLIRFRTPPETAPDGRFAEDPTTRPVARNAALGLAQAVSDSRVRVSLALPPVMLEDWRRIAAGYQTAGAEGVRTFGPNTPQARSFGAATAALKRTLGEGRTDLLDVPYSDPDLSGLRQMNAFGDLTLQFRRARAEYQASLETTPASGAAFLGDAVPSAALPVLAENGVTFFLAKPASFVGNVGPGVVRVRESTSTALVVDEALSSLISTNPAAVPAYLFGQHGKPDSERRVHVLVAEVGPGERLNAQSLSALLGQLSSIGWVSTMKASEAARTKPAARVRLRENAQTGPEAPSGYWSEVGRARTRALPLWNAAQRDRDGARALTSLMVAESRLWAGPDESWGQAERGLSFASDATRIADKTLDALRIVTRNVTLSGRTGKVPVSIINSSRKKLDMVLRMSAGQTTFPEGGMLPVHLKPGENYLTVPVDLGRAPVDEIRLTLASGGFPLAEDTMRVQSSYIDRLATIALAVLVLLVLLFIIRRRTASESARSNGRSGRQEGSRNAGRA